MNNTEKSARPTPTGRMSVIGKVKAAQMINDSKGRIFTATFTAKNGTTRVMNCRRGVTKGVQGSSKAVNTDALGMIKVYDMQSKGFRTLNLQTLTHLKINKNAYRVKA